MTEQTKKPDEEVQAFKLRDTQGQIQDGEYAYSRVSVTLPVGVAFEELLKPEAWVQVSHRFAGNPLVGQRDRVGAVIEVRSQDHSFYAELYLRAVRGNLMDVAVLLPPVKFGPKDAKVDGYEVRWNVGARGYDVIRQSDRQVVQGDTKFPTKELAYKWIEEVANVKIAA